VAKSGYLLLARITMTHTRLLPIAALLAAATMSAPCAAQYTWIGADGVKQYSDQPPPASIPASRILHGTADAPADAQPAEPASGPTDESPATTRKPMTLAEQNAAFNKRRAEQAEKERKAAEQARMEREKSANCERARTYRNTLASGQRIMMTNRDGERSYLSDEQRTQELHDVSQILAKCR